MGKDFHVPMLGISARTWMAAFFYLFGRLWRRMEEGGTWVSRYDAQPWWLQGLIALVLALMVEVVILLFGSTSMLSFTTRNALPYMLAALCGTMMVVYVSRWLVCRASLLRTFLVFTGRHTFEVLTWHFSCFKLVSLLLILLQRLPVEYLAWFPVISTKALQGAGIPLSWTLYWWFYLLVGAGIPLICQWVRLRKRRPSA